MVSKVEKRIAGGQSKANHGAEVASEHSAAGNERGFRRPKNLSGPPTATKIRWFLELGNVSQRTTVLASWLCVNGGRWSKWYALFHAES